MAARWKATTKSRRDPAERVRTLARVRLEEARLPRRRPVEARVLPATGRACCVCDLTISAPFVEYELEFELDDERVTLPFHVQCRRVWEAARDADSRHADPTPAAQRSQPDRHV